MAGTPVPHGPFGRGVAPVPSLDFGAAATHEVYSSYVKAGFTPDQAMQLVVAMIAHFAKAK